LRPKVLARIATGRGGSGVGGQKSASAGQLRFLDYGLIAASTLAAYAWWIRTAATTRLGRWGKRRDPSRRTLLLLAWYFPPAANGGTFRPLALARYGPGLGWNVVVATNQPPRQPDAAGRHLRTLVPDQVTVTSVAPSSLRASHSWFPRIDGGFLTALATVRAVRGSLGGLRPDAVFASGPPFHLFVAGYYLARAYRCPLVLDYRDEWTECPFDFVEPGNADRAWERRCLAATDAVVFTTRSQLKNTARVFSELDPAKGRVIPNGWEPADRAVGPPSVCAGPAPAAPLTLSYVGHLGPHVSAEGFLRALAEVIRRRPDIARSVRVRFVGKKSGAALQEISAFPHPDKVELVEQLPQPAANRLMQESSALLLFNDSHLARYIPGKLYEYVAARRPILVFGAGGESAELVRSLRAGWIIPAADSAALEAALDHLRGRPRSPGAPNEIEEWLARHTRERLAQDTFDLLGKLAVGGGATR
jgi:glycosyltransferase involved in cell wall biosynthesis